MQSCPERQKRGSEPFVAVSTLMMMIQLTLPTLHIGLLGCFCLQTTFLTLSCRTYLPQHYIWGVPTHIHSLDTHR